MWRSLNPSKQRRTIMTKDKHTAAPGDVSGTGIWAKRPLNARVRIAEICVHSPMNGINWKANALLMAAGPELFAALEQVLIASEDCGDMEDIDWSGIRAA